jgi:hypothetical protein
MLKIATNSSFWSRQSFTKEFLSRIWSNDLLVRRKGIVFSVVLLVVWLAGVIFTTTAHEYFRDEVRIFSLARAATSPLHLFELMKYDGHPILWYLMIYLARLIADTPLVLPTTSIIIAFAAVAIFMFSAPFPLWFRGLFIFGSFAFYEYSVMARNYGISMLLLFAFAALYVHRAKHPWLLAVTLALLANTNVHSAVLASLLAGVWVWDTIMEKKTLSITVLGPSLYAPLIIVGAGLLLCAATVIPDRSTTMTDVYSVGPKDVASSFASAVMHPGHSFPRLMLPRLRSVDDLILYVAVLGLIPCVHLFLAALSGQVALGMLFGLVYAGGDRHQGLFLVFLLSLYWIAIKSPGREEANKIKRLLFNAGLYGAVLILLSESLVLAERKITADIRMERSSSKAFGEFLNGSPTYRRAIIVPEPDYLMESLPYYAKNPIYLVREQRFGTAVSWTSDSRPRLSLGDLLSAARQLKESYRGPVLIVLGHWDLDTSDHGEKWFAYKKFFSWSTAEVTELKRSTEVAAEFNSAMSNENYRVYMLK